MFKKDDEIILIKTGQKDTITQVEVTSGGCYYYLKDNGRVVENDIEKYNPKNHIKTHNINGYVLYHKEFEEYMAKPQHGYTTDELDDVAMFDSKEEAEEYLKGWVYLSNDFIIKKMKIRIEVVDI